MKTYRTFSCSEVQKKTCVDISPCLVCFVSRLKKGTRSLWGQVNIEKKIFRNIFYYFRGFAVLNDVFVSYSQNQLKRAKSITAILRDLLVFRKKKEMKNVGAEEPFWATL